MCGNHVIPTKSKIHKGQKRTTVVSRVCKMETAWVNDKDRCFMRVTITSGSCVKTSQYSVLIN